MKNQISEQRWVTVKSKRRSSGTTQPTELYTNGGRANHQIDHQMDQPRSGIDSSKKQGKLRHFGYDQKAREIEEFRVIPGTG
jgi:hypothetical protein